MLDPECILLRRRFAAKDRQECRSLLVKGLVALGG